MLDINGLFRLELKVRTHADSLRRAAATFDDAEHQDVRAHASMLRREADEFEMVANLVVGLQGNWTVLGPMVRESYAAVQMEFARRKAAVQELKTQDAA